MSAVTVMTKARKEAAESLRAFYSRPIGWGAVLATAASLAYVGGGVMFWFHAIHRGEAGPPINDWYHWFFDSSLGFIALTPALFLILPGALWAVDRARAGTSRAKTVAYVALVGMLFGVATGPGPFLHDRLVGRGEPLARLAVKIFGYDPSVAQRAVQAHSSLSEMALQVVIGVPAYVATGLLALVAVRMFARRARRA